MAFDSEEQDPRDYLTTKYGGLSLHIKPGHGDAVSLISTFLEDYTKELEAQFVINRFLSAMAWKDGRAFVSLDGIVGGARPEERDRPRFNYSESRILRSAVISPFDFEHLQNPPDQKQKLALALYREGLGSNMGFYSFLSFFKVINIGYANGHEQVAWINANLDKPWNHFAQTRLTELKKTVPDIGNYLLRQGRDAVAHAFSQPVLDPDLPLSKSAIKMDTDLMQGLAEVFIQEELGVPSLRKIWHEHLYELEGFKRLFGGALTDRLKNKENVPLNEFPVIPPLVLNLKEQPSYECLTDLTFRVAACKGGIVLLTTDHAAQPMEVTLALDFPAETLELVRNMFGFNRKQEKYTDAIAACFYRFLIGYFCNGSLQIFHAKTGERLSHKLPFIPVDVDLHATVDAWKKKIEELGIE